MKRVLVIGAGLGGLAAAIHLARAGHAVEIWERNEAAGGKLRERHEHGFSWGTGPSILTMPQVLRDLFTDAGERIEDHLSLLQLDSCCRYFWTDGTVIDEDAKFWQQPEVARFLDYARGIYELSGEAYLNRPPSGFWRAFTPVNWPKLRHLGKVATTRTMAREIERWIFDPHLRQIFLRFATYNGSSPFLTPATFNIIPFVEAEFGGWYVRGGLPEISRALARLAEKLGVDFHFNRTCSSWHDGTATADTGATTHADLLVYNGDVLGARTSFLTIPPGARAKLLAPLLRPPLSTSGFILFLGVRGCEARLDHHNIFFSDNYEREFNEIHQQHVAPTEPTIYISISARHDQGHAPIDHDNYFVLVNVPARDPAEPWSKSETWDYRERILARLSAFGLDLTGRIVTEQVFTPTHFARRDLAHHGALYGWASHSIRASLLRPPLRAPERRDVYFVGGTTHPGGGIPLVLLSGKMVAEMINREHA